MALWLVLALSGCAHLRPIPPERLAGMVRVPAGEFIMGHGPEDGVVGVQVGIDSMPRVRLTLPEFWIDRTEVTVAQYREFVQSTGHHPFPEWAYGDTPPRPDHPVFGVSFDDARAYCAWKGKRLPTEAEWEKAARGTDGRLYPWGNEWDPERVVFQWSGRIPDPVGSHPGNASPYGALDMAGNVMEWTDTWYEAPPGSTLQRPRSFGRRFRVLKGGSWESPPIFLRSGNRYAVVPDLAAPGFGFRCVISR